MPIPAQQYYVANETAEANPGLRLVPVPAVSHRGDLIYPRLLAHVLDACVLTGFSVYAANFFSVLLISMHQTAISANGKTAAGVFREAFAYSSSQLFAASFASLAVLYFIGLPMMFGRTPGQSILGLRISGAGGAALTLRQHVLRMGGVAFTYGSFGLLCLVGLRKRDGQFLQDAISDSRVERE